jgi:cytochrome c
MQRTTLILLLTLTGIESAFAADRFPRGPELGTPAGAHDIAAFDRDVMPDGAGLPPGHGAVDAGRRLYEKLCESCHGKDGLGDSGDQLAGAQRGLNEEYAEKTIGNFWPYAATLFDFIRRSMPMQTPGSLADDEVYALTAYLLYLNGIVDERSVLDAKKLAAIRMPNRDGFIVE